MRNSQITFLFISGWTPEFLNQAEFKTRFDNEVGSYSKTFWGEYVGAFATKQAAQVAAQKIIGQKFE